MSLEVVCGPMFSGKSSYIYSAVKRYASVGMNVVVIKPSNDIRYSVFPEIITHDGVRFECVSVLSNLMEIDFEFTNSAHVIIIDEAQFFMDLVVFARCVVENEKKALIIVGLDGDSDRKPFGQILDCIPLADKVTRLSAMCSGCMDGTPAMFTKRLSSQTGQVLIGGADMYIPVCRACYLGPK